MGLFRWFRKQEPITLKIEGTLTIILDDKRSSPNHSEPITKSCLPLSKLNTDDILPDLSNVLVPEVDFGEEV